MKIIEPSVEYWKQGDNVKAHVAKCARVCYGKESGNDDVTINTLLKKHHWSMFRHESVYAIIPVHERELKDYPLLVLSNPYIKTHTYNGNVYVATNGQFILDKLYPKFIELINMYRVTEDEFSNTEFGFDMMRYTFCVITQISTSRELNRASPNNISEQSTRYVYENGSICRPYWVSTIEAEMFNKDNNVNLDDGIELFLSECNNSFNTYKFLINQYNFSRQDARGVLPLDTATKCVYTYSIDEWKHIIKLRTDKAAHPNAQIIANMIKNELENLGYKFN